MSTRIPVLNLQLQHQALAKEMEQAVLNVLRSGSYILGEYGAHLETQLANLCGCKYGIGVANGTDALHLALWSLDLGPGDEVITTPFTFAATVEAILLRGAKPVFVDADESSFNIDVSQIEAACSAKTKALIPVHLYGLPSSMTAIMEIARKHSLYVVEDNAQAIGAKYDGQPTGSFGDLTCLSFYPTKNLGACGDAGMIVTNNARFAERLKALRAHGMKTRYFHDELGLNSRLDELQAAILLTKLQYLDAWTQRRQALAALYNTLLADCPGIVLPRINKDNPQHVWHQYTIRVLEHSSKSLRDTVMSELSKRGIGSMCYYPVPLHLQKAYEFLGYKSGDFPVAEMLAKQVLSLPMYPELLDEQVTYVSSNITNILNDLLGTSTPALTTQAPASAVFS